MRVLFLLTQSLDFPSGLGRYGPLATEMVRLGYDVEIAALHPAWSRVRPREFVRHGVKIAYVGQMHVSQPDANRRTYFSTPQLLRVTCLATLALARVALTHPSDAIHIGKAQPMNGLAGWLGGALGRRRLYLDCDDDEQASNRFSAPWQQRVVRWAENSLPPHMRGVTVNTTYLRDRLLRSGLPAGRIQLVPNGYDQDRFSGAVPDGVGALKRRWEIEDAPAVLYLGSLSLANHPVLLLLDAFRIVRRRVPAAVLLMVGGGEDYDECKRLVHARGLDGAVRIVGRVDPATVPSYYAASAVSVDPVFDDPTARARSPLKIVESMAMGVPVVTGDSGDRAATLAGGRAGVLVQAGNAEALADGIVSVLGDPARRNEIAMRGREVSQAFRWDCLAREFVRVYDVK